MKALQFRYSLPRLAATKILGTINPSLFTSAIAPVHLTDIAEIELPGADWVRVRTDLAGVCGSDLKEIMLNGAIDNPLTSLISFPHVLGHEAVGTVEEVGADAHTVSKGDRVILNPWLSCAPRGIDPPCPACATGDYTLCRNFDSGSLPAGIHIGNNTGVPGAFARSFVAHQSQLIRVPHSVSNEAAVLADPFAVSLHSVLRRPPHPDAPVLVYGLGTLGLCAVAAIKRLYPDVPIYAVGRHPHQIELARRLGADEIISGRPKEIIEEVARLTDATIMTPWNGLPWILDGVGVVYDTVGSPETIEVGIRVAKTRGSVVVSGVEAAKRFEWTPIYFKEVDVTGSNAFAVEEIDGVRKHAMQWYVEMCEQGLDMTPLITHRFTLDGWREVFATLMNKRKTRALKIVIEPATD
jgi:threonine dehydrogenase-like Zn-dependent dehydrogenase